MGLYDRDYYREPDRPSFAVRTPRTVIGYLILVNVAIYVIDAFAPTRLSPVTGEIVGHWLSDHMAIEVGSLTRPWMWWQLLTYGFAHSPLSIGHVLFNMLTLFFLGRDVEARYGSKEFLRLYMAMLVFAGLAWVIVENLMGTPAGQGSYGASGAVTGIVVLFALLFPRRTLLLFFVIPVPAWAVGVLVVVMDAYGAANSGGSNINHVAHLSGAAFAFLYFRFGWNLGRLVPGDSLWRRIKRQPRLRVHDPEPQTPDLSDEVDRILRKISATGEASLSRKERRVLQNASREYQQRKRE